jgi:hypothetical protein
MFIQSVQANHKVKINAKVYHKTLAYKRFDTILCIVFDISAYQNDADVLCRTPCYAEVAATGRKELRGMDGAA